MSYILDALNKSEQERQRSKAPGIDTIHRPAPTAEKRRGLVTTVLAVLVVVNIGAAVWWFESHRPTSAVQATPGQPPATKPPATANPAPTTPRTDTAATASPAPVVEPTNPVPIAQLPLDIQHQIPAMTFSSHIYSDDAQFRMVNINGRILHEGDMVSDEIRLVRITEDGVVLHYRDYTFEVSVLRDWQAN